VCDWLAGVLVLVFGGCLLAHPGRHPGPGRLTPGKPFLAAAAIAFVVASLVVVLIADPGALSQRPVWELLLDLFLYSLPPALLAGQVAAKVHVDRPLPFPPDVEAAARSRFRPGQPPADSKAIRPADDGMQGNQG
jgi:hypothetical protein